ncbi:MAG: NADH-quinone oxidoreductase subunit M [bacterium]
MLNTLTQLLSSVSLIGAPLVPDGGTPWLTLLTFAPLLFAAALMLVPREQISVHRTGALIATLAVFVLSLPVMAKFNAGFPIAEGQAFTFQFTEGPVPWITSLGISYALGIDGISLWLVMLTTFIMPIAVYSTFSAVDKHVKEYMIALLVLEAGMIGALVSVDVFLFYVFWEMMLIPMYFIIGVWGGEDRVRAAVKFFIYTMVGSVLMLIAILYVYFNTNVGGAHSFLFADMLSVKLSYQEQLFLFAAFFLAFAIKVPLFPFHTWLPLAHVQAPTAGSVILAAVMLKMGTYGLLRYAFPLFPDALKTFAPYIAVLSVIGIVYGALLSLVQDDVKKLVAYSSVSHLGFCVLGLVAMTPQGIQGGLFIMLAHGIATGGLFLCVGILYERRHTKKIKEFGGVASKMPVFAAMFMIITFASVGLPGLNGFIGEFLAIIGTSQSKFLWFSEAKVYSIAGEAGAQTWQFMSAPYTPIADNAQAGGEMTAYLFAGIAASGVIFAAGYLLWMFRRVMFGPITNPENEKLEDLNTREILYLVPIVLMAVFMGVYPKFFLGRMEPSVHQFLQYMDTHVTAKGTVVVEDMPTDYLPTGPMVGGDAKEGQ